MAAPRQGLYEKAGQGSKAPLFLAQKPPARQGTGAGLREEQVKPSGQSAQSKSLVLPSCCVKVLLRQGVGRLLFCGQ